MPNLYVVNFKNVGGLVMPLIVQFEYDDGSIEVRRIPAEIWRRNNQQVSKLFVTDKRIKQISLDPRRELADADTENNFYPRRIESESTSVSPQSRDPRRRGGQGRNPMQKAQKKTDEGDQEQDGRTDGANRR